MTDATRDTLFDTLVGELNLTKGLNEYYKDIIEKDAAFMTTLGYDPEKVRKEPTETFAPVD